MNIEKIQSAHHIQIVAAASLDAIGAAGALYTYIMTLHKKASLQCSEPERFVYFEAMPWITQFRRTFASASDLALIIGDADDSLLACEKLYFKDAYEVYGFMQRSEIKINLKMATALYCSIASHQDAFRSIQSDGMEFAIVARLIELGALHRECNRYLFMHGSLGALRLKAKTLSRMQLFADAKVAAVQLKPSDLESCGADFRDIWSGLEDMLSLVSVKAAVAIFEETSRHVKTALLFKGPPRNGEWLQAYNACIEGSRAEFVHETDDVMLFQRSLIETIHKEF
ncbi:MAG: hypothetical protein IE916_03045 [Epsilonproteobacteria bacterium]|nr:hypothetical protein [Campylobacterota bacterium]